MLVAAPFLVCDPEAGRLFVSPPVNGWVVVMGGALPAEFALVHTWP